MTKCHVCGTDQDRVDTSRSYDQHKRFFKMVEVAYNHWPVTHERQFSTLKKLGLDECRKFLTMKAGHYYESNRLVIDGIEGATAARIAEGAFRAAASFSIAIPRGNELIIYSPKSISFSELSHHDACVLFDKVNWIIRDETGVSGEELLERELESA